MTFDALADKRPFRVGVTNAVLSNTGDAAIFASIIETLRAEFSDQVEIVVFDSNARVTRKLYPQWTVYQQVSVSPPREPARLRRVLQAIRARIVRTLAASAAARSVVTRFFGWTGLGRALSQMRMLDVMVSSGGTYLVDHYNFQARVDEMSLVDSLGIPSILWTQSMGPFRSARALAQIRSISTTVGAVFLRDELSDISWRSATDVPIPTDVVPDSVFALKAPPHQGTQGRRALISVREWSRGVDSGSFSQEQYAEAMRAAARTLSTEKWAVDALSTCQGVPSYAYDDSVVAKEIFSGTSVSVNGDFHSPAGLLEEISRSDLIVTTRMHLAILGLISRVPVIAVAYEFKTIELFKSLGLSDWVVRIEDATPVWLEDRVRQVLANPEAARLKLEQIEELRSTARRPVRAVRQFLERR